MLKSRDPKRPHRCSRLGRLDDLVPRRAANVPLFEVVSCLQISSHSRSPSGCQLEPVSLTRFWAVPRCGAGRGTHQEGTTRTRAGSVLDNRLYYTRRRVAGRSLWALAPCPSRVPHLSARRTAPVPIDVLGRGLSLDISRRDDVSRRAEWAVHGGRCLLRRSLHRVEAVEHSWRHTMDVKFFDTH